jgi:Ca2+-binding EF-hand superfamily protein
LREAFQVLDRDSDGQVGREDVADMLTQLGNVYIYEGLEGLY